MRTLTSNNTTFEVPSAVAMAFNPFIIHCSSTGTIASLECAISGGATITFDAYDNECICDLREWLQVLFDGISFDVNYSQLVKSGTCKTIGITLTARDADGQSVGAVMFNTDVIWGALDIGETFDGIREVTWWSHYPFSVGVYTPTPSSLYVSVNGAPNYALTANSAGIYNVPITNSYGGSRMGAGTLDGLVLDGTFDSTFDLTFRGSAGTTDEQVRIKVASNYYDEGYYLRWVDRRGFACYHLLKSVQKSIKVTAGEFQRNNLYNYNERYGYLNGAGRRLNYTRQETIPVCAPLVSQKQWDTLSDLLTSPVVDLFMGYDENDLPQWSSVVIETGTYTKTDEDLQDFICNIVKPDLTMQTL